MAIDRDAYARLEEKFRRRVGKDRELALKRVGREYGVYVPNVEPTDQADYVLVAMEPNFGGKYDIKDLERRTKEEGLRGFQQDDVKQSLGLFLQAIKLYLCPAKETTYWLTDLSKGAMPPDMADLNRDERYEAWYPLLLEEIELIGKPNCRVIAIGRSVEDFLRMKNFGSDPKHSVCRVLHYSFQAAGAFKAYKKKDKKGFGQFVDEEVGNERSWPEDFTPLRRWMAFYYRNRFREIRDGVGGV